MDKIIKYFKKPGPQNTEETIMAVGKRVEELNIKHIQELGVKLFTGTMP